MRSGGILKRMRFIEHHRAVIRKRRSLLLFERADLEIDEKQRMIRNHDIGVLPRAARLPVEAVPEKFARGPRTVRRLAAHARPELVVDGKINIVLGTVLRLVRPVSKTLDGGKHVAGGQIVVAVTAARKQKTPFADIVAASLRKHEFEIEVQQFCEKRKILVDQLLLQIERFGRDENRLLHGERGVNCGNQIGETLADSGRSLDAEIASFFKRGGDFVRHDGLLRTRLVGASADFRQFLQWTVVGEESDRLLQTFGRRRSEIGFLELDVDFREVQRVEPGTVFLCLFSVGRCGRGDHICESSGLVPGERSLPEDHQILRHFSSMPETFQYASAM